MNDRITASQRDTHPLEPKGRGFSEPDAADLRRRNAELEAEVAALRSRLRDVEQHPGDSLRLEIEKKEAQHRRLIDNMIGYVGMLETDGTLIDVNDAALRLGGLSRAEVIGKKFWETNWWDHDDLREQIRQDVAKAVAGETVRRDTVVQTANGGWLEIDFMIVPVRGKDGEVAYLIPSGTDISERKRAEEALRESEDRLRRATAEAPLPLIIHAEDGSVLMVNRAWSELTGYTAEDIPTIGDWTRLAYGKEQKSVRKVIERLFQIDGRVDEGEFTVRTKGGTYRTWSFSSAPLGTTNTGQRLAISMAVDVTEQRAAERQTEQLAAIVRTSQDAIFSKALDGTIISWNRAAQEIFGYAPEEIVGKSARRLLPPDRPDETDRILGKIRSAQPVEGWETQRLCKDKKRIDVSLTVSPIRDSQGNVTGASVIARDITRRKQLERQLQQLNSELEQRVDERTRALRRRNEELDEFAHVASHDLKAPLRAIDYLASWIQEDAADVLPNESREHLRDLRGRIDRMERLLEDLLAYARVDRIARSIRRVEPTHLIQEIIQTSSPMDGFTVDVQEDMPVLQTARAPLELVLRNLIDNAVKHHDHREGVIRIGAKREDSATVHFWVSDDGPGIPLDHHEKVFKIFETLRPRDEVEGSGMGLALVKKSVQRFGGQVWIESGSQRGTTVHFTWRRVEESE